MFIRYVSGDSAEQIIETAARLSEQEITPITRLPTRRVLNYAELNGARNNAELKKCIDQFANMRSDI